MELIDWFKDIAFALNDDEAGHEFTRYPLDKMVNAYNAGVCLVHKYREDLFTEWRIVKLDCGEFQDVRGCCEKVLGVAGQTDADGNTIKRMAGSRKTSTKVRQHWDKPSCIKHPEAPNGFVLNSAEIDSNMDGRFRVWPPVPEGTDVYARIKCVAPPCPINEADVHSTPAVACTMLTALWYFVMARMLSGDRYSEATFSAMQYNHKMFFSILDVVEQQEDKIESPQQNDTGL